MMWLPWIKVSLYVHQHKVIKSQWWVASAWLHGTKNVLLRSANFCFIVLSSRLSWICHEHRERKIPLGFQSLCFLTCGEGGPFLKHLSALSPPANRHLCPPGSRTAGLSCNFGFRDKCSLPFSGGAELLPAIKALQSNSPLSREHNLLPPVIKSPWCLWFCQHCVPAPHLLLWGHTTPLPLLHQQSMDASVQRTGAGNKSSSKIAWQRNTSFFMCLSPNWIKFLIRFTAEPQTNTAGEPRGPCTAGGKMKQAIGEGWKGNTRSQNWCWRLNLVKPQPHSSSQEKVSSCWPALFFLTFQSPIWTLLWPWGDCSPQSGKLCPRLAIQS